MAFAVNDRIKETSTTTGASTFSLDGAVPGFETFSSAIGNSNTTYYTIQNQNVPTEFEVGLGTVGAGTLARTTVISSSNSDSAVDFSAGTKDVFCTLPASTFVPGKLEGTNFTDSLLIGHATTGTLSSAQDNTGVGIAALDAITSGDQNTAVGSDAGTSLTTAGNNTLIGAQAGDAITGAPDNTAIGSGALSGTMADTNSGYNVAVGANSLNVLNGGAFNVAVGRDSGRGVSSGDYNILIGYDGGDNITSGAGNVIIGTVDADSATGDRQLKIAGHDGSTTTTWISGTNAGAITFNSAYTFPTADGSAGKVLTTDGSGTLTFETPTTGDITGVTAGTNLTGGGTSGDVTINLADASTSAKGAASFSSDNFAASSGAITIKDLGIATGEIQDDAITLGKMAPGTDGNIISYDTSGNPVAVATGSSGQVLTSAGAGAVPSFQTPTVGDITSVVAGTGLTGGGTSGDVTLNVAAGNLIDVQADQVDVDLSELTTSTSNGDGDFFCVVDSSNAQKKLTKGNINNSGFNNDAGYTTNTGDITSVVAGSGLTGGATSGAATLNIGAGNLIDVQADQVDVDLSELSTSTSNGDGDFFAVVDASNNQKKLTKGNINNSGFNNDAGFTTNTGTVTSVGITPGTGLDAGSAVTGSGTISVDLDLSELTDMTATMTGSDEFIVLDSSAERRKAASEIGLSIFNNDAGFTTNTGDITSVVAGSGLTGGATSGAATLNIGAGTGIDVAADAISVDVSDFMSNGSNNRIVTATGADAQNAEANLTFDGSTLDVSGTLKADKGYVPEATLTDGSTINWNMSTQSVCKVTLAGNRTMAAPSNGSTGQFASIVVIQDGTGGRTLTWNAVYEFASDTAPTLTATANLGDLFVFRYNGSKWLEAGRNLALTLS